MQQNVLEEDKAITAAVQEAHDTGCFCFGPDDTDWDWSKPIDFCLYGIRIHSPDRQCLPNIETDGGLSGEEPEPPDDMFRKVREDGWFTKLSRTIYKYNNGQSPNQRIKVTVVRKDGKKIAGTVTRKSWTPDVVAEIRCSIVSPGVSSHCQIENYFEANTDTGQDIELRLDIKGVNNKGWAELFKHTYLKRVKSIVVASTVTDTLADHAFDGGLFQYVETITLPEGMRAIGTRAFSECRALTTCTLPSTITTLGKKVFYRCYNLQNVNVENVTVAGVCCFEACKTLETIDIRSLLRIPSLCFKDCSLLTDVILSLNLASIGDYAFQDCGKFEAITYDISGVDVEANAFIGTQPPPIVLRTLGGTTCEVTGWYEYSPSKDLKTLAMEQHADKLPDKEMWSFVVPGTTVVADKINLNDLYNEYVCGGGWAKLQTPWLIVYNDGGERPAKRRKTSADAPFTDVVLCTRG